MNIAAPLAAIDRVVVLNDRSLAHGGATTLAIANALGLHARGVPVTFIAGEGPVDPALAAADLERIAIPGVPVSPANRFAAAITGLHNAAAARTVRRWIAANDTPGTVYHLHNWAHFLSPATLAALAPVHRRLVITAHDRFLACGNGAQFSFTENRTCTRPPNSLACITHRCDRRSHADKLWRVARHAVRTRQFDLATLDPRILAIHAEVPTALAAGGVPPERVRVLPNPVRAWLPRRVAAEANREFLFVGRLSHEKGPDLAARAARLAGVPIAFAGDGPLAGELRRINPDARLLGQLDHAGLARAAGQARALAMTGRLAEPFGLVAGEALWSGLPVILSDNALLAPAITAAGAGLAVDRTPEAIAAAMHQLGQDDERTRRMSVAAFTATRHLAHTPDGWIEALLAIYRERLAAAPGAPA